MVSLILENMPIITFGKVSLFVHACIIVYVHVYYMY